jgi:hypothetical protein
MNEPPITVLTKIKPKRLNEIRKNSVPGSPNRQKSPTNRAGVLAGRKGSKAFTTPDTPESMDIDPHVETQHISQEKRKWLKLKSKLEFETLELNTEIKYVN